MDSNVSESELVRKLRQQVHKSFLQINQMEKLMNLEIEHSREEMEERERGLKEREEEIRVKYSQIENNLKQKQNNFMMDIEGLELSMESIAFKKEDEMLDSGIFKIRNLLSSHKINPEHQIQKLQELQRSILSVIPSPTPLLYQFFQISNEFCLDNCRLKQELLNYQQTNDVYKNKIQQYERIVLMVRGSESSLKQENRELSEYYIKEQVRFQEEIGFLRDQINSKKAEIQELKNHLNEIICKGDPKSSAWINIFKSNKYAITPRSIHEQSVTPKDSSKFIHFSNNKSHKENTTSASPSLSIERPSHLVRRRVEIKKFNL